MWAGRDDSERIASYYSYLFTFPSRGAMLTAIATISTAGGILSFTLAQGAAHAVEGLLYGLLGLAAPILASDILAVSLFKDEAFLTPRRFTILSYVSCILYASSILLSSIIAALTGRIGLLARGFIFAVAVNAFLRNLSVSVFSTRGPWRNLAASFLQPALCFSLGVLLLPDVGAGTPLVGATGAAIMVGGVQLLLLVLSRWEGERGDLELIPLFRAFILAWAEELNEPLEDQISHVGEARDLPVDTLVFSDDEGDCKAALVVPYIHPGPFRNVGSSGLPDVLAERLGEKLGCEVLVPHGVSTHERDLTRSAEVERVAEALASDLPGDAELGLASPLVWAERNGAKASSQMFGDVALVTLTLSPKSYDDLPEELGERITEAAVAMGVTAVIVDSHNSLSQEDKLTDSDVDDLFHAAVKAVEVAKMRPRYSFSAGAARVVPDDWGLDDGMGPGGIAALAIRLENGHTCAYVVLDGNNMRSGLRERIIDALKSSGVDEAEVLTSDTHLVNAIGATSRGYFPIGERTDERILLGYVRGAVAAALSRLEPCSAAHRRTEVRRLTVLGERGLRLLGDVLESAFGLFRRTALGVVPASLLLAAAVIFLL
ncbi:MAG: DUF2070 family protein [Candidatus Bathyarchaeia archaeon]